MIKVASQQQMKETNARIVLRLIRNQTNISRAALAKMTKLSPTTISSIVEELIAKEIVVEKFPMENKGAGRKAISLEINGVKKYIIGMELSHEGVSGTVFNLKNETVLTIAEHFNGKILGKEEIVQTLKTIIHQLMHSVRNRFNELLGICIGVPALLDPETKSIVLSTPLHMENIDLYHTLQAEFAFPLLIENDTFLASTAEKEQFEKNTSPFIYLSINEGLGVGVIIKDQFIQGANGVSLEIGHMSLDSNGPPCLCGNRGCFELYVSVTALSQRIAQEISVYPNSVLLKLLAHPDKRTEDAVAEAVRLNDPLAESIVDKIAEDLGNGIVNLINVFNPEAIVIGGRLSKLRERLLEGVRKQTEKRAIKPFLQRCRIGLARQSNNTISIGASIYALNKLLDPISGKDR